MNIDISHEPLEKIAQNVLKAYDITPENITLIQGDSIKTVWKVRTHHKNLCLKRLKQSEDKARFSVNAQIYIKDNGGRVPGVIAAKGGRNIVERNGQLFVLYEWIDGKDLNFENPVDLKKAIQGLADFHKVSKNYMPDENCRVSSKTGKWPDQYRSMLKRMDAWRQEAEAGAPRSDYQIYVKHVGKIIDTGSYALKALEASAYDSLTGSGSPSIVLCHQDFGRGNALDTGNGVYILDLDGVTFDLPARDLRKLIGKNAAGRSRWEAQTIREIVGWYCAVSPMSRDEKRVLYLDLLFPHWFFGLVKNLFQNGKPLKQDEVERTAKLEESKIQIIKELLDRSE